ncbi:hypothetical protein ACFQ0K_07450 [Nocardioides caeni]|uniref:DUF732 domain-containing protein n=1 Tax=Nocardioides caeni TaxID=574700 RepID=A0A4S8N0V8_9ACTN|nr:hypothetical protein [Nocardioides caeni]THV09091.1 hypothetical protein E9934_17440 [Nocardioides caeni]
MTRLLRLFATALAALALALSLAACGDDADGDDDGDDKASADTSASTDGAASDDAASEGSDGATDEGSDGATDGESAGPAAAGTEEFCGALQEVFMTSSQTSASVTAAEWKALQEAYAALGELGTPADATAEQSEGLDILVSTITGIDYAEARKLFTSGGEPDVSDADEAKLDAFSEYAEDACQDVFATPSQ